MDRSFRFTAAGLGVLILVLLKKAVSRYRVLASEKAGLMEALDSQAVPKAYEDR